MEFDTQLVLDLFDQVEHFDERVHIGVHGGDLGSNVAVDANDLDARELMGVRIKTQGLLVGHAKLVAFEAG